MINFGGRLSLATLYTPPEEVNTAAPLPAEPIQICEEVKSQVCIKVTLINFTVTSSGLEEQLLGDVVIKEKPEVEATRQEIVVSMDRDKKTLKQIEDKILTLLRENEVE